MAEHTMPKSKHPIPKLVGEAGQRADDQATASMKPGRVTAIREDHGDKGLAHVEVQYLSGGGSKNTVTVSKEQLKQLALGDSVEVTTTIEKVG